MRHRAKTEKVREFEEDHRRTNPGLHNLYVRGAYEDLRIVRACLDELEARSRVPASIMAGALHEAMQKEIERSAAFFEAAALLFTGLRPTGEDGSE